MTTPRLAIVNWRDPWHPSAGGAERYAWELATRLISCGRSGGREVTYVTSRAPGQRRRETVDGVHVVRLGGGRFGVYPLALLWFLRRRRRFEAVIDCQNGIPFFTPWVLARTVRVFCVVHHVHTEQFGLYFPPWLTWVGRGLEGPVARWTYRRHAYVVVSQSTLNAVRERLRWTGRVHLVPNGHSVVGGGAAVVDGRRPQLVCVSRLVPHKRLTLLLDLAARRPDLTIGVIGDGPEARKLAEQITARGLDDQITLHGYVSEDRKAALVARADLHVSTSGGEGWGLSVIEAAALGIPTVAFDVPGLRDAVRDGITGWLVPEGDALEAVVDRALKELSAPVRRAEFAAACRRWAAGFTWDRTAAQWATLLAGR